VAKTNEQGKILEQLVAWLHQEPGVVVQHDVRLATLGGGKRKRQFDVLLTSYVAGHPVRLAIECKNEQGPIGVEKIDAFRGKLEAVGIPPSLGIYVSAGGYTEGALDAARGAGIRPFTFEGLSADRLSQAISNAFQSVVVLLPCVTGFDLTNDNHLPIGSVGEAFLVYDEKGRFVGNIADFVWQAWQTGDLEPRIGTASLRLEIPEGWHSLIEGRHLPIRGLVVRVEILALVMTVEGEARRAAVAAADTGEPVRQVIEATFETPPGLYALRAFRSEDELREYLTSSGLVHLAHRVRSPRINFWNMMYWPPSQRVAETIAEQMRLFSEGRIPDPRPFSFEQIEGHDPANAWEPIADEYLAGLQGTEEGELWQPG